jgi:hypothetical protein
VFSGAGYLASRAFGVGPFATPISRGQLPAQARVVLADFAPIGVDTSSADAVTELLRVDLGQSRTIRILEWDDVRHRSPRLGCWSARARS